jgi:hypothetical protein
MIPCKQLSLADVYADCREKLENDKYRFLETLENAVNLEEIVPVSFVGHYRAKTGRKRKYPLFAMLWALILQKLFSLPTDSLLIVFLKYSKELRDFCGFSKVPDASKFTRFKQDFLSDLQATFDRLVDLTEPLCQQIDPALAAMAIFDTSGVEAYVTENNPKYADGIVKKLKSWAKAKAPGAAFDPYKAAYGSMPSHSRAASAVKQMYINGHFCYAYKFGLLVNGLGIARHISFYGKDYLAAHPEIVVEKKSDSPDEDKSLGDARALLPTLRDFFQKHPLISPKTFLGDAAFDSIEIYRALLGEMGFEKALIPLKTKLSLPAAQCPLNDDGIPCCPKNPSLPMRREGSKSHLRCGLPTMKFVCPKMKWTGGKRRHFCDDPCTTSPCGRMTHIYPEKNLRAYPGVLRSDKEWNETYKIRVAVEKSINHFKDSFCVANRKTQNAKTIHADLLLAGITQLLSVIVSDKIHRRQYLRSLKPLAA